MASRVPVLAVVIVIASAFGAVGCSSPPPVQVTGTQLESALLPATDFGQEARAIRKVSSGSHLTDKPAVDHIATMSCDTLLRPTSGVPGVGQTAYAKDTVLVFSATPLSYGQSVLQFASPSAATADYQQYAAANARCRSATLRTSVDHVSVSETIRSVSEVQVGGHQAVDISISETLRVPGAPASATSTANTLVIADGVDVFSVARSYLESPPQSLALAAAVVKLIARIQALR